MGDGIGRGHRELVDHALFLDLGQVTQVCSVRGSSPSAMLLKCTLLFPSVKCLRIAFPYTISFNSYLNSGR